jgi:hypothetical protein
MLDSNRLGRFLSGGDLIASIIRDAARLQLDRPEVDPYLASYPVIRRCFQGKARLNGDDILLAAVLAYGWIPRTVRFDEKQLRDLEASLQASARGALLRRRKLYGWRRPLVIRSLPPRKSFTSCFRTSIRSGIATCAPTSE